MKVRPTQRLIRGTVVLALTSATAFFWWPMLLVFATVVATLVVAAAVEKRRLKAILAQVAVTRTPLTVVGRGMPFKSSLTIANSNGVTLYGEVRDEHPLQAIPALQIHELRVEGDGSTTVATTCRIEKRGRHRFGKTWVRVVGPLQLLEGQRAFDTHGEITVLPETFASRERIHDDPGGEMRLLDQARSRQSGIGTEFESLSAFRQGDDPRRIDWRATARRNSLVVRRFQVEHHRDVMIVLDSGRLMGADVGGASKLDCAVDGALNLARVVLASGDRCGVAAYDHRVRGFLSPVSGQAALGALVECIYDIQTEWHESDFTPMLAALRRRQAKRTLLVVVSDLSDAETSRRMCDSLVLLQRQHLVLFVALRTPHLGQVVHTSIDRTRDVARAAVAFRLLRERRRALHSLTRRGIHVVDVEPDRFIAPLVNRFIELRQRNLL